MTRVGVFIEPTGALLHAVQHWKTRIADTLGEQPYGSHPPHSTLIHAPVTDPGALAEDLSAALKEFSSITVAAHAVGVFEDDPLTGGQTLFWEIARSEALASLQRRVADAMRCFLIPQEVPAWIAGNPVLSASWARYGFPFVGDHWRPHMTAASVRTPRDHPLVVAFLAQTVAFQQIVAALHLVRIDGDRHEPFATVTLDAASQDEASG